MKVIKHYFRYRPTFVAITVALVFQLVFSVIWITGYQKVNENIKKIQIGIVNEDHEVGATISQSLMKNLALSLIQIEDIETAKRQLDNREVSLIIHIPKNTEKPMLHYITNESNSVFIKSMMQSVTQQVTEQLNKQASTKQLAEQLKQVPANVDQLLTPIATQTEAIHSVNSYAKQMIPMMLVLASFVGGMFLAMNLDQVRQRVNQEYGKWVSFFALLCLEVVCVLFISAVGAGMIFALGEETVAAFWQGWLFQSLMMIAFVFVAQTFLLLLGEAGMIINTVLLSLQLVTSGAMIPRDVLPTFYQQLGDYLPATYGVEGIMNMYMGGPSSMQDVTVLFSIALMALLLQITRIAISNKKGETIKQPAVAVES